MEKHYRFEISRKKFWTVIFPIFIALAIIMPIIGFTIVNSYIMPHLVDVASSNQVEVPQLVGRDFEEARQICFDRGILLRSVEREYNDTIPENVIILQNPAPGEIVKRGRVILATVSIGSEISEIPDVFGLLPGPAQIELRRSGFQRFSTANAYSDDVERGRVISTEPQAGITTSRDGDIRILVSDGEKPTETVVPSVVGLRLSDARSQIVRAGLRVGDITYSSSTRSSGVVLSQSVSPGTTISFESRVNLVVSTQ